MHNTKGSYTWSQKSALDPHIFIKIVCFLSQIRIKFVGVGALFWLDLYET